MGEPDFQQLQITLHRTPIKYGVFLNDLLQFMLLAVALFVIIKFMTWIGVERGRSLDQPPRYPPPERQRPTPSGSGCILQLQVLARSGALKSGRGP